MSVLWLVFTLVFNIAGLVAAFHLGRCWEREAGEQEEHRGRRD